MGYSLILIWLLDPELECKVYERRISIVLGSLEKYILIVMQLHGKNINDFLQNANAVDAVDVVDVVDVGKDYVLLSRES